MLWLISEMVAWVEGLKAIHKGFCLEMPVQKMYRSYS